MSKKYFVYLSSTREDLKAERREVIRIISELGAIPVTTDAFDIKDEEDRRIIYRSIEECDYFLSLVAHKRGENVEKTFALELEYNHAVKVKIPVLALIIGEKARWKESKKEKDAAAKKALAAFKKKLEVHTHEAWVNMGELKQKALFLLSREMNINPQRGWVPSTDAVAPSVANELSRLIRENEILKNQIGAQGGDIIKQVRERIRKTLKVLATNRISLSFYYTEGENWENARAFRYLKLFRLLAPELSTPKTVADISRFFGNILNPDLAKVIRKDYPTPSNTLKKIMADFALLKLVKCSEAGEGGIWEMTEYGKEAFAELRLRQMSQGQKKKAKSTTPRQATGD